MKKWCNGAGERQFGRLVPQVLGCLNLRWCPKSQEGWRAAGLDPFVRLPQEIRVFWGSETLHSQDLVVESILISASFKPS